MVQKFGKFGVRSGNSLKGSNSKYFRRYRRDALVYRESINCKNALTSSDTIVGHTDVVSDEVPYSLNKKGRWSLPDELKRAILTGELRREEFGVQLVEVHKITKSANCVAVYATRGPLGKLAIQKRRRTRCRKRTGYMQPKSIVNAKPEGISKRRRRDLQRRGISIDENTDVVEEEPSQVRYEIVYPSPATSSVTHNPKYIGHDTVKPHSRVGHKKRRRKHHSDFISEELYDMDQRFDESEDEDCYYDNEHSYRHMEPGTVLIGDIIKQTAHDKRVRYEKPGDERYTNTHVDYLKHKQNKLVYTYVNQEETETSNVSVPSANTAVVQEITPLSEPVYVCLKVEDVNPSVLRENHGERYIESESRPRRFVVDISEMACETKLLQNHWKHCPDRINANVVFVFDSENEVNTSKEHIYKVYLNTPLRDNVSPMRIETMFDYMETTVNECLRRSLFFMETLADQLDVGKTSTIYGKHGASTTEILANWKTSSYLPNNTFVYKTFLTVSQTFPDEPCKTSKPSMFDENTDSSIQTDKLCSICYETPGLKLSGTALISCGHWVCDICWKQYLVTQVRNGATSLVCPEFDCDTGVDPGTTMSLLSMKDIMRYARCCHDTKVEQQAVTKWCPNERCGRVIQVNSEHVEIVNCACGQNLCFKCNERNHWPAPCDTTKMYYKKLKDEGLDDVQTIEKPGALVVQGMNCPSCNRFFEKNGGCPFMYCICRNAFCWGCGKAWKYDGNHGHCLKKGSNDVHSGTLKKVVRPVPINFGKKEEPKSTERILFDTAVHHRNEQHRERVKQMKNSSKNLFKKLQLFVDKETARGKNVTMNVDSRSSVGKVTHESGNVNEFLNEMMSLHYEINHIAEHTAVLLLGVSKTDINLVKFLKCILDRFKCFSEGIHESIVYGHEWHPRDVIKVLNDAKFHSLKAIGALIRRMKSINKK